MNACFEQRVAVPDQVSLIGFDDILFAKYTNPALTTIRRPVADIGELGMRKLIELMQEPDSPPEQLLVPTSLMVRGTVAKV